MLTTAGSLDSWPYPGSRWWKFDFHSHTPASLDSYWTKANKSITPEEWMLRYMAAGIDCVVVTDHNTGAWVDELKDAYRRMKAQSDQGTPPEGFRELVLFPGVEISVQGGFHLIAILDIDACTSDIDNLLGKVGFDGPRGSSDSVTRKGAATVIADVLDSGAIPVPAHVDGPKGLLELESDDSRSSRIDSNTLVQVLDLPGILAMEVLNRDYTKPENYSQHPVKWAEVLGSDSHGFEGRNCPGSRYTWVKMERPSLEGLRLALLDGNDLSLRRSDDSAKFNPFRKPRTFITRIEVEKARYMGNGECEILEFSPYFNALVGGRGTGKSTVVQALRLAYRRDSELAPLDDHEEVRQRFERFRQVMRNRYDDGAMRSSTEFRVSLIRDNQAHRLIWRADGNGEIVEDGAEDGSWQTSRSQAVNPDRFPVRILSQGQIAAMAGKSRQGLIEIIDEAAGVAALQATLEEEQQEFLSIRAQIRVVEGRIAKLPELQRKMTDLEHQLEKYEKSGASNVYQAHQRALRQRREVRLTTEQLDRIPEQVSTLADDLALDDWPENLFDGSRDGDILKWRADADQTVANLRQGLVDVVDQFKITLSGLKNNSMLQKWRERVRKADSDYSILKEGSGEESEFDPQTFVQMEQDRQKIESQIRELKLQRDNLEMLRMECDGKLNNLLDLRKACSQKRAEFVSSTLTSNQHVQIEVIPFGNDPKLLERELRTLLEVLDNRFPDDILHSENGQPSAGLAFELAESADREATLAQIKDRIIRIDPSFGGHFRNFLERKLGRPEFEDHVLRWFPKDDLKIKYQRGPNDWARITEGSQGQRSAALLAFLLAFGDEPLVLDQPEDDLDNHLIYDLIVRQIRENKLKRQLLIVTHNPNVVVNGDAEMIHALDFVNGQCTVTRRGALQDMSVRNEVCQIMEGGREAFARRWARLGKDASHEQ